MSSSSSLAGQAIEPVGRDDHMAGGAGHLPFAGAFQRHDRQFWATSSKRWPASAFGLDPVAIRR
jgi:hypothetical protein